MDTIQFHINSSIYKKKEKKAKTVKTFEKYFFTPKSLLLFVVNTAIGDLNKCILSRIYDVDCVKQEKTKLN